MSTLTRVAQTREEKKVWLVAFVKKRFTVVISTAGASVTYHGGRRKKRRRKRERQMVYSDTSRLSERCMLSTLLVFSCVLLSVSFIASSSSLFSRCCVLLDLSDDGLARV